MEVTPREVGFPGARLAARLETRVRRKGKWCREVVHLLGSLSDVRPLMLASAATVLPSRREGLSRSVLESLTLGIPVLGARVRGIADLVPDGAGTLVEPDDVQGLAAAMRRAWLFPRPAVLRQQLDGHLQQYSLDRLLLLHEELYEEALRARGRPVDLAPRLRAVH